MSFCVSIGAVFQRPPRGVERHGAASSPDRVDAPRRAEHHDARRAARRRAVLRRDDRHAPLQPPPDGARRAAPPRRRRRPARRSSPPLPQSARAGRRRRADRDLRRVAAQRAGGATPTARSATTSRRRSTERGRDAVVRRHLAHLVDGLSGAAFHGVIRLAYALESASDARVAAGLAYLTEVHQPLGARGASAPWSPTTRLRFGGSPTWPPSRAARCLARRATSASGCARSPRTRPSPASSTGSRSTPGHPVRLTDAAVALYAATDDFTALHGGHREPRGSRRRAVRRGPRRARARGGSRRSPRRT